MGATRGSVYRNKPRMIGLRAPACVESTPRRKYPIEKPQRQESRAARAPAPRAAAFGETCRARAQRCFSADRRGHRQRQSRGLRLRARRGQEEAVFLPPPQMVGVMHGDRVRVRVERGRDGRYSGKLETILEHATKSFVGTLEVHGRTAFVTAADRRVGMRCLVAARGSRRRAPWRLGDRGGDALRRVRVPMPQARVTRRLDPEQPVELACEAAIARFDLPREFSPEAVREAESYGNQVDPGEAAQRLDLRGLPLVTIDGEDAKDFDDAVYAEPHAEGLPADRRDCRRELLRAPRHGARRQRARARHLGVFPDARDPDVAVRVVERVVLAAAAGRPAVLRRGHDRVAHRAAAGCAFLSGGHAFGGAAHLHEGVRGAVRGAARGARRARAAHRQTAAAAGCVSRAAEGASQTRRAGVRCRRSRVRHRRRGPHPAHVSLRAQRGAQAHRGVHDPRERGRGA